MLTYIVSKKVALEALSGGELDLAVQTTDQSQADSERALITEKGCISTHAGRR